MRSKLRLRHFAPWLCAVATACTGGEFTEAPAPSGSGGAGAAAVTGGSSATGGNAGGGNAGGGGAGGGGDGNDSFEQAESLALAQVVQAKLQPTGDSDYYEFTLAKGQAIHIQTAAQDLEGVQFDPAAIDTVITLYDENQNQIAENDDPIPRTSNDSELFTVAPADGTYFLRVTECSTWAASQPGVTCPDPDKILTTYRLAVFDLPASDNGVVDERAAEAALEYEENPNGNYHRTIIIGDFDQDVDEDTFTFTVPGDVDISAVGGRPTTYLDLFPVGPDANGSSVDVGKVWIEDAANAGVKIAELDGTKWGTSSTFSLEVPVEFGTKDYVLHVESPGTAIGVNPFYFLSHFNNGSNPVEAQEVANNAILTAEVLTLGTASSGTPVYWIAGDMVSDTDVDYYKLDITTIDSTYVMAGGCRAQRVGSGLRDMKFSLLKADDSLITEVIETPDADATFGDAGIPLPAGETAIALKIETGSIAADVTGAFYTCNVAFYPPS